MMLINNSRHNSENKLRKSTIQPNVQRKRIFKRNSSRFRDKKIQIRQIIIKREIKGWDEPLRKTISL